MYTLTDTSGESFIAELDADVDHFLVGVIDEADGNSGDDEPGTLLLYNSGLLLIYKLPHSKVFAFSYLKQYSAIHK